MTKKEKRFLTEILELFMTQLENTTWLENVMRKHWRSKKKSWTLIMKGRWADHENLGVVLFTLGVYIMAEHGTYQGGPRYPK